MLFSLLISHYNNYNYFLDCYKSILAQTCQKFEVIIVDDCSTDNSYKKLQELLKNDARFKLYRNEQNKGVGFTKRKCADLATGELCAFLDPDDALVPEAVEEMSKFFEENKSITAAYSQLYLCDKQLSSRKVFEKTSKIKSKDIHFFNLNFEVAHFFVFRKEKYLQTEGINPILTSAVDQDLYLKLYETGDLFYLKKPLYLYRLHNEGVSQNKQKKEKLNENWNQVLADTLRRRSITKLYGKPIEQISSLQHFIQQKQNNILQRFLRKFS